VRLLPQPNVGRDLTSANSITQRSKKLH